ncbi:MAG: GDSL-type esterase/lipase family protein [Candidatus Hydrogenedentales bacterium]
MSRSMWLRIGGLVLVAAFIPMSAALAQLPNSMAVIGDSISQAALSDDSIDPNQPEHSWSTGNSGSDPVFSHYERILASNPGISGRNHNNSENGADSGDLVAQANQTVSQGVEYVTILIGGNDVCAGSTAGMTSVAEYTSRFNQAIDILQAGLPGSIILVVEVPNVGRIYDVGRFDFWCLVKWDTFGFCDNMLTNGSTQRNAAKARNVEYNNALRTLSSQQGVFFDDDTFEINFSKGSLSNIDCFHPDMSLQATLASVTYSASRF